MSEGGCYVRRGGDDFSWLVHNLGRVYAYGRGSLGPFSRVVALGIQTCDVEPHPVGVTGGQGLKLQRERG